MSKNNDYKPGNPEYDFWNDKNLYPSLRNEYDADYPGDDGGYSPTSNARINHHAASNHTLPPPDDHKTTFGTVLLVVFLWLLLLAPFALFCTWSDGIVQVIFWGGLTLVVITCALAFYNAFQAQKRKKK